MHNDSLSLGERMLQNPSTHAFLTKDILMLLLEPLVYSLRNLPVTSLPPSNQLSLDVLAAAQVKLIVCVEKHFQFVTILLRRDY